MPASPSRSDVPAAGLLRDLFARQEAERHRIARALHNEIGQALSAIKMSAHLIREEADPARRNEDLDEIVGIADATVARLRELYAALRPAQMDALGLAASLRGEAEHWQARFGLVAELDLAETATRADPVIELAAFRLAQDLIVPQSTLSRLSLRLHGGDALRLEVGHDGQPPDPATAALLHARADAAGGELSLHGDAGDIRLHARLPWHPPSGREAST